MNLICASLYEQINGYQSKLMFEFNWMQNICYLHWWYPKDIQLSDGESITSQKDVQFM